MDELHGRLEGSGSVIVKIVWDGEGRLSIVLEIVHEERDDTSKPFAIGRDSSQKV